MKHIEHINEFNSENNIKRITDEIETAINKMIENPDEYVKYDKNLLWNKLLHDAKENNYRGNVITTNDNSNKKRIVYYPKKSFLQTLGSAAANARRS